MKKILMAGVVSVAFVAPAWAGCDPPGGGYGNCPSTPAAGGNASASASAASHATAGAAASVTSTNRNDLSNTNTNRIVVRNVINTGSGSGSTPPLTVAAPITPAAAAPAAPATSTPAATPAADPAADPSHTHAHSGGGGGHGNGGGYYNSSYTNNYPQEPVATAYAPSFGTVNPCVGTSASLGAQFQLFGLSAGGQNMDEECRMLRLGTQADVVAARNLICLQSSDARTAYYEAGLPCPADRQKYADATHAQAPVAVVQPVSAVVAAPHKAPDWCAHASKHPTEASAAYIARECGG